MIQIDKNDPENIVNFGYQKLVSLISGINAEEMSVMPEVGV